MYNNNERTPSDQNKNFFDIQKFLTLKVFIANLCMYGQIKVILTNIFI